MLCLGEVSGYVWAFTRLGASTAWPFDLHYQQHHSLLLKNKLLPLPVSYSIVLSPSGIIDEEAERIWSSLGGPCRLRTDDLFSFHPRYQSVQGMNRKPTRSLTLAKGLIQLRKAPSKFARTVRRRTNFSAQFEKKKAKFHRIEPGGWKISFRAAFGRRNERLVAVLLQPCKKNDNFRTLFGSGCEIIAKKWLQVPQRDKRLMIRRNLSCGASLLNPGHQKVARIGTSGSENMRQEF